MGDAHHLNVLTKDLMALQLGQVDLLMAMYASDNAISVDNTSSDLIEILRDWSESDEERVPQLSQECINLLLTLEISHPDLPSDGPESLQLSLSVPVVNTDQASGSSIESDQPEIKVRIQQPAWMSRSEVAKLNTDIPNEDILSIIEWVKETASESLKTSKQQNMVGNASTIGNAMVRVWFYFPSISTRSKRDDLVNCAPSYGLTGFLLAGKPGVLCLEGDPTAIDDFMKFIKTESWGDIPSHHKKVSERYREMGSGIERAFFGMQEITDMIGERRGERANRNDMKALEAWLQDYGLGAAFEKVLM